VKRLFFFIAFLSLLVAFGNQGWVKLYKLRQAEAAMEVQSRRMAADNEKIRREIEDLNDPKYLDHLIRNDMGFARDGESLFEFVEGNH
jgi:cell division protein FtsB